MPARRRTSQTTPTDKAMAKLTESGVGFDEIKPGVWAVKPEDVTKLDAGLDAVLQAAGFGTLADLQAGAAKTDKPAKTPKGATVTELSTKLAASLASGEQAEATGRTTTGDNGHGHKTAAKQDAAKPDATPAVKPETPQPIIELTEVPIIYIRPTVKMASGQTIQCKHPFAHENTPGGRKSAMACGRKMAANGAWVK
jgi:hypothetical protein